MGVGTAEAEGADAGQASALPAWQRQRRTGDLEVQLIEGNVGVRGLEVERGGKHAVLQGQDGLQQPGKPGDGLQVTDVGLDRADRKGPLAVLAEDLAQRASLRRIADLGAGAVRFHEGERLRIDSGVGIDGLEQPRLQIS